MCSLKSYLYTAKRVDYTLVDGCQVDARVKDNNSSSWKEMKLGLIFSDRDPIRASSDNCLITKKEYAPYFGSVNE